MRFATILAPLLATTALALPADQSINAANAVVAVLEGTTITAADVALFPELASAFHYAANAQGCKWWKCGAVVLKAPCIIKAIKDREWTEALQCTTGKAMCACGDCVEKLGDFLSGAEVCK